MKRVWIFNHYAQEPGGPGGTRHFSLARHLRNLGWEASIIAASTELNSGRQRLFPHEAWRCDRFDDVPFLWLNTPAYHGNGTGRMRNMLHYSWQVLRQPLHTALPRPDVIIGSSVHPFAAWAAMRLARRYHVPFIFEVRDLWPQTLIDLGRLKPNSPMARLLGWLEKTLYREASTIITLLPAAHEYICPLGVSRAKIVWIPNGVDLTGFPPSSPKSDSAEFVLMYLGSFGNANGIDQLLDAMAVIERRFPARRIRLRLIGDGPLKPAMQEQARTLGLQRVSFEPAVPKNRISSLAAEADAFVVCLVDSPLYRFGISLNKLFDYLAASRPIIFAGNSANNPVAEAQAGITVPPSDPEAFANAVDQLTEMTAKARAEMGNQGRQHVEQMYSFEILAGKLAEVLNRTIGETRK